MANSNRKDIFVIKQPAKEGGKAFWIKAGTGWVNKDGSVNLKIDVGLVPGMDIQMREPTEREDKFE